MFGGELALERLRTKIAGIRGRDPAAPEPQLLAPEGGDGVARTLRNAPSGWRAAATARPGAAASQHWLHRPQRGPLDTPQGQPQLARGPGAYARRRRRHRRPRCAQMQPCVAPVAARAVREARRSEVPNVLRVPLAAAPAGAPAQAAPAAWRRTATERLTAAAKAKATLPFFAAVCTGAPPFLNFFDDNSCQQIEGFC